jgi:hypothetical protein
MGKIRSECGECGRVFASTGDFDKHRVGKYSVKKLDSQGNFLGWTHSRRCMTEEEIEQTFRKDEKGWFVWKKRRVR